MDIPLTPATVAFFLVLMGSVGGLWWRLEARFEAERNARLLQIQTEGSARAVLQKELGEYKLFVATNHVSLTSLRETELRLTTSFDKLATRLETLVNRLDSIAHPSTEK